MNPKLALSAEFDLAVRYPERTLLILPFYLSLEFCSPSIVRLMLRSFFSIHRTITSGSGSRLWYTLPVSSAGFQVAGPGVEDPVEEDRYMAASGVGCAVRKSLIYKVMCGLRVEFIQGEFEWLGADGRGSHWIMRVREGKKGARWMQSEEWEPLTWEA